MNTKLFFMVMMVFFVNLINASEEEIKNQKAYNLLQRGEKNKQIKLFVTNSKEIDKLQAEFKAQFEQCEKEKKTVKQESSGYFIWNSNPCMMATSTRVRLEKKYNEQNKLWESIKASSIAAEFSDVFGGELRS